MNSSRRSFLFGLAGLYGATALVPSAARAGFGGGLGGTSLFTTSNYKVLEIFCRGGLSHLETLWLKGDDIPSWATAPTLSLSGLGTTPVDFGGDLGMMGAALGPLATHKDRLRIVAMSHGFNTHDVAIPLGLTGTQPGRLHFTGTAAAATHFLGPEEDCSLSDSIRVPTGVVLHTSEGLVEALQASATGLLGASATPTTLKLADYGEQDLSARWAYERDSRKKALTDLYADQYATRLSRVRPSDGAVTQVRSQAFSDYVGAMEQLECLDDVAAALGSHSLVYDQAQESYADSRMLRMLDLAKHLLANGTQYANVIDTGAYAPGHEDVLAYDLHSNQGDEELEGELLANTLTGNLYRIMAWLGAQPASFFDDTLVVLNTEFGRKDEDGDGSGHQGKGYAVALLGGPTTAGRWGEITAETGEATESVHPADLRAAIHLTLGIPRTASELPLNDRVTTTDAELRGVFRG